MLHSLRKQKEAGGDEKAEGSDVCDVLFSVEPDFQPLDDSSLPSAKSREIDLNEDLPLLTRSTLWSPDSSPFGLGMSSAVSRASLSTRDPRTMLPHTPLLILPCQDDQFHVRCFLVFCILLMCCSSCFLSVEQLLCSLFGRLACFLFFSFLHFDHLLRCVLVFVFQRFFCQLLESLT